MVQALTLLFTIFDRKATFRIPSIDKYNHFHIPSLVPCIPLTCCKLHRLKYTHPRPQGAISWIWRWGRKSEKNPERYLDFFTAIKCAC